MSHKEKNDNELLRLLDLERETNGLYHEAIKEIGEILIESSEHCDKVSKISGVLHRLTYDFGKQEAKGESQEEISLN